MPINYYAPPPKYVPPPSTHPELEPGQQGVTSDQVNNWNAAATDASTAKTTASTSYQLATSALQKAQAALPAAGGTLTGTVSSTNEIILRSDLSDRNTWGWHNSQNGNLYIAPTATRGGGDYQWGKGLVIGTDNVWWAGGDLNSLKSSVANGKGAIISALSAQGVQASNADEFSDLASKIGRIGARISENGWSQNLINTSTNNGSFTVSMLNTTKDIKYFQVTINVTGYYNAGTASIGALMVINFLSGYNGTTYTATLAGCNLSAVLDMSAKTMNLQYTPQSSSYNKYKFQINNYQTVT